MQTVSSSDLQTSFQVGKRVRTIKDRPEFDCDSKHQQYRDLARNFITGNIKGRSLKILCLPGSQWYFERDVLAEPNRWDSVKFTAVECNKVTFLQGIKNMPGTRQRFWSVDTGVGKFDAYCNAEDSVCLNVHLGLLARSIEADRNVSMVDRKFWNKLRRKHNAIWLDTCNTLTDEILEALSRLWIFTAGTKGRVPVVFTFMRARDRFNNDNDRRQAVTDALGRLQNYSFKVARWRDYVGNGNCPMSMMFGWMDKIN